MTEEVVTQGVSQEEEQAFEAAFNEARGNEPPPVETKQEEPKEEPKVEEPQEPEEKSEFVTEEPPVNELQVLRGEVETLKRQLQDNTQKIHGKLGDAFRTLQQIQQQKQSVGFELSEDDIDQELRDQYPEMAKMHFNTLKKAFERALGGVKPAEHEAPVFDPKVIDERVTQATSQVEDRLTRKYEARMLEMRHPDYVEVTKSEDFAKWSRMQPPQMQEQIATSYDAAFAIRALDAFKQWRTGAEKRSQQKQSRLEAAVVPQGGRPQPTIQDEESAMYEEYERRRRR